MSVRTNDQRSLASGVEGHVAVKCFLPISTPLTARVNRVTVCPTEEREGSIQPEKLPRRRPMCMICRRSTRDEVDRASSIACWKVSRSSNIQLNI